MIKYYDKREEKFCILFKNYSKQSYDASWLTEVIFWVALSHI